MVRGMKRKEVLVDTEDEKKRWDALLGMLGKHFKGIWRWLRVLCCPHRLLGGSIKKARKHQNTAKCQTERGYPGLVYWGQGPAVCEKDRRGNGVHISAWGHCLLREGDTNRMHAKNAHRLQAKLMPGRCYFSQSKHQVLMDPTHV